MLNAASESEISNSLVGKRTKTLKISQKHTKQLLATDVTQTLLSPLPLQVNDCQKQCSDCSLRTQLSSMAKNNKNHFSQHSWCLDEIMWFALKQY